jgi:hypothetical protein
MRIEQDVRDVESHGRTFAHSRRLTPIPKQQRALRHTQPASDMRRCISDLTPSTPNQRHYTPRNTAMRPLSLLPTALLLATLTTADDIVTKSRIKVQLFAAPAFVSEVSVDAYHMQCLSLDNNLYLAPTPPSDAMVS